MSDFPTAAGSDLQGAVLALLDEGVLLHAEDGRVLDCNDSAVRILGLERDQVRGMRGPLSTLEAVTDAGAILTPDAEPARVALRTGGTDGTLRVRIRRPDALPAWLLVRAAPLFGTRGDGPRQPAATGAVTIVQDLSERRLMEQRLQGRTPDDAFGRLAGSVAHDFNHLLTVMLGQAELAERSLPPGSPLRENCTQIHDAAVRAARLTSDLMDFSRRHRRAVGLTDLRETVEAILPMLGRLLGRDITLRAELGRLPLWVWATPSQVERVLLNLSLNARDAMVRGGEFRIELGAVEHDDAFVGTHPGSHPGTHVRLTVADTGPGLTDEARHRLFEPFFTTKPPGQGSGLGLSTVYGIVKQFGGYIDVDSAPGRGTEFRVDLRSNSTAVPSGDPDAALRSLAPGER